MTASLSPRMTLIASELATIWLGHPTVVMDAVDSTNLWLKERWSRQKMAHGAAVWADAQTSGRGRLGRSWESPPNNNIYTSMLVEPPKERLSGVLSLVAGAAMAAAVREVTGLDARMKWPNDGVIGGRKFCGILVEAGVEPSPWAIVGIGINVLGTVDERYPNATSLEAARGKAISREDLWLALLMHFESAYDHWLLYGDRWAAQQWTAVNATLGESVQVQRPGEEPWTGTAERVDDDGGLWVSRGADLVKVIAGEVQLRLADGRYAPDSR